MLEILLIWMFLPFALTAQSGRPDSARIGLTLGEARALAARQNPLLLAARQNPVAAAGLLQQAQSYRFNPELAVTVNRNPEVTLMQELEWGGQRGLRIKAATAGLMSARYETADAARLLMVDVGKSFYRALASAQRRQVVEQVGVLSERLIEAVRIQLREGEISLLDANLAEIELGRVRAHAATARREATGDELHLKQLLGISPSAPLRLVEDITEAFIGIASTDSLIVTALRERPDLQAVAAQVVASRAGVSLAQREAIPNLRAGVVAEHDAGIGIAFGISLPLLNRNRGTIAAREADLRRAELIQQAVEHQARSDVAFAVAILAAATEELTIFSESVLRPARASAPMLEQSYREGKIPLTTLLLLRNQLLDAEIGYWDSWLARREALVDLDAATGRLVPAIDQPIRADSTRNPKDFR